MFDVRLAQLRAKLQSVPRQFEIEVERLLQADELSLSRQVDRVRFVIKVPINSSAGPILITKRISRASLAEGNIPKMAGSMVTAFTATVAGLGAAVLAYLIALTRERWVREDVGEMAHAAELVISNIDPKKHAHHYLQEEIDNAIAAAA